MHTLILDRKGATLSHEGNHLVIRRHADAAPQTIPIDWVSHLVLAGCARISPAALIRVVAAGGTVTLLDSHRGQDLHALMLGHGNTDRRVRQTLALNTPHIRLAWQRQLVRFKILTQYRQCQRWDAPPSTLQSLADLARRSLDADSASLLGLEGSAARLHYECLSRVLAPDWQFRGRNRRPPRDPVNALISLTCTLLTSEAVAALNCAGLDAMQGAWHQNAYGRPGLACDLVEPMRARVDHWIVRDLIGGNVLMPDHFTTGNRGCFLDKAGRQRYYTHWAHQCKSWRRYLRRLARDWARRVDDLAEVL